MGEYQQIMQDRYEEVKASIKDSLQYKSLSTEEKMDFINVVYHSSVPFGDAFTSYEKNNKDVVNTLMDLTI
ncbi:Hypothetical protein PACV_345 [Pacmanvirus A23]|uniref:Hypothetical protein n=1 Tax=Pacmanvirus A23 TaxID=1932881 RepID=UPI000A09462A|nr:Hypothetical protein B9W72_gp341 [Pacmanvirus A23]SIP86058.1 Hypothetical protein PACV_345 [Pacmanvirus A23]